MSNRKKQCLEFKLSHRCDSGEWEIAYELEGLRRTICYLTSPKPNRRYEKDFPEGANMKLPKGPDIPLEVPSQCKLAVPKIQDQRKN